MQNHAAAQPPPAAGLVNLLRRSIEASLSEPSQAERALVLSDGLLAWADRRRWWLFSILFLLYLAGLNGQWRMQPDAALYLSLGRNLAEGKGYTYLGEPNRLAYPGWPTVVAGVFKVFGSQSLWAVNLMASLLALMTVGMVYRLVLLHRDRPTAVVVAVGVGFTKAFYCYGFELWADMLFALATLSLLAGYEGIVSPPHPSLPRTLKVRRRLINSTLLFCGLLTALVTRPTGWPLLAALGCALPIDTMRGRIRLRSLVAIFAIGLLIAAILLLSRQNFGTVYSQYILNQLDPHRRAQWAASIGHNLRDLLSWAASDVLFQVRLGWFVNSLLSVGVLLLGFGLFQYRSLWGFWFCLLLLTVLISQTTLDRYFLPVLPLLVFAWWDWIAKVNRLLTTRWSNLVFLVLLGFGSLLNFTKVCGIIAQQHRRPFLSNYDQGRYEIIPELSRKLAAQVENDAVVLIRSPYGRVTAFLSRRNVQSAAEVAPSVALNRKIYVIEPVALHVAPLDSDTVQFLFNAHLAAGPEIFRVAPSPHCGPNGMTLALHSTVQAVEIPSSP